ncbi:MAG: hypothetical protein KDA91_07690 [Planctomycetaceae bacterium]|nr:hypothetical protein [Planctomycetaceae bacterium]
MNKSGLLSLACLLLASSAGCMTGPTILERHDQYSGLEPGSDAWWAEKAALPGGVRNKCYKGKQWPPVPRSTEEPQQFSHTYYAEHYWPLPYVCQDRAAVAVMMEQQVSLGWQDQTTLYDQHFDENSHQISRAGRLHLQYILRTVPEYRRTVYVQSTFDAEQDAMRMQAVQTEMQMASRTGSTVPVVLRECSQYGRPAAEVDQIHNRYLSTMPSPRLKGGGGGGSSGGGGAAGGGGGGGAGGSSF